MTAPSRPNYEPQPTLADLIEVYVGLLGAMHAVDGCGVHAAYYDALTPAAKRALDDQSARLDEAINEIFRCICDREISSLPDAIQKLRFDLMAHGRSPEIAYRTICNFADKWLIAA